MPLLIIVYIAQVQSLKGLCSKHLSTDTWCFYNTQFIIKLKPLQSNAINIPPSLIQSNFMDIFWLIQIMSPSPSPDNNSEEFELKQVFQKIFISFARVARPYIFFKKMGQLRPLLSFIFGLFTQTSYKFYNKYLWKNVYPVNGAGIRTHDLWNISLLS